jgi:hypothetical protein
MLLRLTRSFRVKAAIAVAALYAFCILLPATAFALADGRMAPPCLLDDLALVVAHNHAPAADVSAAHHHHDDGTSHDNAGAAHQHHGDGPRAAADPQSNPDSRPGECCGLFPLAALAGGLRPALAPARLASSVIPALTDALTGREPDRIIRPPIA